LCGGKIDKMGRTGKKLVTTQAACQKGESIRSLPINRKAHRSLKMHPPTRVVRLASGDAPLVRVIAYGLESKTRTSGREWVTCKNTDCSCAGTFFTASFNGHPTIEKDRTGRDFTVGSAGGRR